MKINIRRKTKKMKKKRIRKTKTHRKVVKGGLFGVNIMSSSAPFEWTPNTKGFLGMIDWTELNNVYVIYKEKKKIPENNIQKEYFNKNLQFFLDNRWKADLLGSGIYIVFEKAYDVLGNSSRIRFSDLGITDKEELLNAKIVVVFGFLIAYIIQYTPVMIQNKIKNKIKNKDKSSETQATRISNKKIYTEHNKLTSVFYDLTFHITYASGVDNFLKNNNLLGIFNSVKGIDVYHRSTGHPEYTAIFSNFLKGIYNSNASRLSNFLPFISGSDKDMKKTMEEYFLPEILGLSSPAAPSS